MKKNSGFIAQTRLYTNSPAQHGLKAIEDIQIGDKVLCMPELGGGTPIYKTVLHIVKHEQQPLWFIQTAQLATHAERWSDNPHYEVLLTSNFAVIPQQMFWLVGSTTSNAALENFKPIEQPRWVSAEQIPEHGVVRGYFDGAETLNLVQKARPLSAMKDSKLAWLQGGDEEYWVNKEEGFTYDLENKRGSFGDLRPLSYSDYNPDMMNEEDETFPPYHDTVYSLIIEDYSTYFVGLDGIWVHQ